MKKYRAQNYVNAEFIANSTITDIIPFLKQCLIGQFPSNPTDVKWTIINSNGDFVENDYNFPDMYFFESKVYWCTTNDCWYFEVTGLIDE